MANINSAPIIISSQVKVTACSSLPSALTSLQQRNNSPVLHTVSGRCAVLELLMPALLGVTKQELKPKQKLTNIDGYMLQETQALLNKVTQLCGKLKLQEGEYFKVQLNQRQLMVSGQCSNQQQLALQLNQDKDIKAVVAWLHPNYLGLTHSQELVTFSHAYSINRQQALQTFEHFQQPDKGLACYLSGAIKQGKVEINWHIESPLASFQIDG